MAYGAPYWEQYYRGLRETGEDLDWEGLWTGPFLTPLRETAAHSVLELGCGTGNDAARLAVEGHQVAAIDLAAEALVRARTRHGDVVSFLRADVNALEDRPLRARRLPVARELEKDYVLEQSGQAVRFFSEQYLRDLLQEWDELRLETVELTHRRTQEPKRVWRGIARR